MEEVKAQIAAQYDMSQILDILGLDEIELVEVLWDKIYSNLELFTDIDIFVREEEDYD